MAPARIERSESGFGLGPRLSTILCRAHRRPTVVYGGCGRGRDRGVGRDTVVTRFTSTVAWASRASLRRRTRPAEPEARRLRQDVGGQDPGLAIELGPDGHPEARQVDAGRARSVAPSRRAGGGRRRPRAGGASSSPRSPGCARWSSRPRLSKYWVAMAGLEGELAALGQRPADGARVEVLDLVDVQGVGHARPTAASPGVPARRRSSGR